MIGYTLHHGDKKCYLRFAVTDPYMSARHNRAMVAIFNDDKSIDQENYNLIYDFVNSTEVTFDNKTLKVR